MGDCGQRLIIFWLLFCSGNMKYGKGISMRMECKILYLVGPFGILVLTRQVSKVGEGPNIW